MSYTVRMETLNAWDNKKIYAVGAPHSALKSVLQDTWDALLVMKF